MRKKEKVWEREREGRFYRSLVRAVLKMWRHLTGISLGGDLRVIRHRDPRIRDYVCSLLASREKSLCYPSCRKIFFDDDHWKSNREYHRLMIILIIFPYEFTYSISNERQNFSFKKLFIWSGQARKIMYLFNLSSVIYQSNELTSMLSHVSIRWSSYFLLISK